MGEANMKTRGIVHHGENKSIAGGWRGEEKMKIVDVEWEQKSRE